MKENKLISEILEAIEDQIFDLQLLTKGSDYSLGYIAGIVDTKTGIKNFLKEHGETK